jgi:hypothetical protein
LLGAALLLGACTGDDEAADAAADDAATTTGPAEGDPPSEETDSVQTDPPVTGAGLVLTFAEVTDGVLEAAAFVQGTVEVGGSCVLTAEQDGTTLEADPVPAEPGPSTTDCGALSLELPADAEGSWTVSVVYTSASSDLTSESLEVTV